MLSFLQHAFDAFFSLGGFSMGGGMALHLVYRFQREVAGCFSMSSFLNKESVVYKVNVHVHVL